MRLRTSLFLHVLPWAVLALAAWLLVSPLGVLLEDSLALPFHEPASSPPAAVREQATLSEPRVYALLGMPLPRSEQLVSTPRPRPPFGAKLLGTLSSSLRERSVATLLLPTGRAVSVWEGDQVLDAQIVEIARNSITLRREGVLEELAMHPPAAIPAIAFVTPITAQDYAVSRMEIMTRLGDLYSLSKDVRVMPAFRDGQPIGFRFAGLSADSAVAKLGLKTGDVIRSINGQPLDSMQRVLGLVGALDHTPEVLVQVEREGQLLTHRYRLN
ncbi:MAG: hypothetical protein GQE15_38340 [Archangiaceae bacterium]|nr:hypothetical protein [Archangiaceae bacterium]